MQNIERHESPDVVCFTVNCLRYMCLHSEALTVAHQKHRGFLIWAQENILITKLWQMLRSDFSQIGQISVPLIMHCLTLPGGPDALYKVVNEDMTSKDWNVRFLASKFRNRTGLNSYC